MAVAGDVADDQPRVHRLKLVGGQPHPGRGAGREVLHEHVGRRQQPQQHLASPWVLDVEGERLLAAVGPDEVRAQAVDAVVVAAGEVAGVGPLDLDHPGAEVGQLPGRVRRGDRLLERDDGRTTKRLHDDSFDDRHGAHHHRMSAVRGYAPTPRPEGTIMTDTDDLEGVRARTRALCSEFPDEYWRETDLNRRYPQEFVDTLTTAGLLSALIPTEYGGPGMTLTQAWVIMEEINKSGGHSAACHAQMYTMGALLRHGSDRPRTGYLPPIAKGELRLQAFSVTEPPQVPTPPASSPAPSADGDDYVSTGTRTGRVGSSSPICRSCSPAPAAERSGRTSGLSLFLIDLRRVRINQPDALESCPCARCSTTRPTRFITRGCGSPRPA